MTSNNKITHFKATL